MKDPGRDGPGSSTGAGARSRTRMIAPASSTTQCPAIGSFACALQSAVGGICRGEYGYIGGGFEAGFPGPGEDTIGVEQLRARDEDTTEEPDPNVWSARQSAGEKPFQRDWLPAKTRRAAAARHNRALTRRWCGLHREGAQLQFRARRCSGSGSARRSQGRSRTRRRRSRRPRTPFYPRALLYAARLVR